MRAPEAEVGHVAGCRSLTPLHVAADKGHTDAVELLVKSGAKVGVFGIRASFSTTALFPGAGERRPGCTGPVLWRRMPTAADGVWLRVGHGGLSAGSPW